MTLNIHSSRDIIARHGLTLPQLFSLCLEFYKEEKHQFQLTYEQKNQLAAYWKQSVVGPYHPDKITLGYFDFVGNDRKKAWEALGEISTNGAMAGFCNLLETACPNLVPWIRHKKRETETRLKQEKEREEKERQEKEREEMEAKKLINIVKRADALKKEEKVSFRIDSDSDSDSEMPDLEKNDRNVRNNIISPPKLPVPEEIVSEISHQRTDVPNSETALEALPDTALEALPDTASEAAPGTALEPLPDTALEALPETASEAAPGTALEAPSDTHIDVTPMITVEGVHETVVEAASETAIEATPEADNAIEAGPEADNAIEPGPETAIETVPMTAVDETHDTDIQTAPMNSIEGVLETAIESAPETVIETKESSTKPESSEVNTTESDMEDSDAALKATLTQHLACVMYLDQLQENGHQLTPEQLTYLEQMEPYRENLLFMKENMLRINGETSNPHHEEAKENETVHHNFTEDETSSQLTTKNDIRGHIDTENETINHQSTEDKTIVQKSTADKTINHQSTENETSNQQSTVNETNKQQSTENETSNQLLTENETSNQLLTVNETSNKEFTENVTIEQHTIENETSDPQNQACQKTEGGVTVGEVVSDSNTNKSDLLEDAIKDTEMVNSQESFIVVDPDNAEEVTALAEALQSTASYHTSGTDSMSDSGSDCEVKLWSKTGVDLFIAEVCKDDESILQVGRGETVTVRIPTYESGSALYWEFATQNYDIGFGASFEWEEGSEVKREPVIPILRRSSQEKVVTGSHAYPRSGTYLLLFDNSYSLLRSKTVYYRVFYTR